jgi:hypothetical protein
MSKYDSGSWSYYDRFNKISSRHYDKMHIRQLKLLYLISEEHTFKKYYKKFKNYLKL